MLETKGKSQLAIGGQNQQKFSELELVAGAYPYQVGLQKRIPGKTIQQVLSGPIGSIYVFYMVYGRMYRLLDFGSLQITEIPIPPEPPWQPPQSSNTWYDTFEGYTPDLISRLWGGGAWLYSVGICETIIQGKIDPYAVYSRIEPGVIRQPPTPRQPPIPPGPTIPNEPREFVSVTPDPRCSTHALSEAFESLTKITASPTIEFESYPPESSEEWAARGIEPTFLTPSFTVESVGSELCSIIDSAAFVGYGNIAYGAYGYSYHFFNGGNAFITRARSKIHLMGVPPAYQVYMTGQQIKSDGAGGFITVDVVADLSSYKYGPGDYLVVATDGNVRIIDPDNSVSGKSMSKYGEINWHSIRVCPPGVYD